MLAARLGMTGRTGALTRARTGLRLLGAAARRGRLFRRIAVEPQVGAGDALIGQLLDGAQIASFAIVAQRNGDAFEAGARGAADAMDVALRHFRQFEIDHMADRIDVDTARRDIGGDQHRHLSGFKTFQRALALVLALVAVNGVGRETGVVEEAGDAICAALGAGEDDGARKIGVLHQVDQRLTFAGAFDQNHALLNAVGGLRDRRHGDLDRLMQHFASQRADFRRHGRREKQGLPSFWQFGENLADRRQEAEIEHVVGLIQHDRRRSVEPHGAGRQVIEQAAGGGDQNVEAGIQRLDLRAKTDAAENHRDTHVGIAAIGLEAFADLGGQFARRGEHQHTRLPGARRLRKLLKTGQDRRGEGAGLAGAGLGDAQQVAAFQQRRNRLGLDGGGNRITLGREGA